MTVPSRQEARARLCRFGNLVRVHIRSTCLREKCAMDLRRQQGIYMSSLYHLSWPDTSLLRRIWPALPFNLSQLFGLQFSFCGLPWAVLILPEMIMNRDRVILANGVPSHHSRLLGLCVEGHVPDETGRLASSVVQSSLGKT